MKAHVLRGSKREILERLVQMSGEVREAMVFEDGPLAPAEEVPQDTDDIFAEMRPFLVDVQGVDDSREAIYTRADGE